MNIQDFRENVINPIRSEFHDWGIVYGSYLDILNILDIAHDLCSKQIDQDLFQLLERKEFEQASILRMIQNQVITLLKGMYLFANIFVDRFLIEITHTDGITLQQFLGNQTNLMKFRNYQKLNLTKLLSTYCIVMFRHKMLAHFDVYRCEGARLEGMDSRLHFSGVGDKSTGFPKDEIVHIDTLKKKYSEEFPELIKLDNYYEISKYLFYHIPLGANGAINSDRLIRKEKTGIDNIIEKSGVESNSFNEIINSIDEFVLEFVRILQL